MIEMKAVELNQADRADLRHRAAAIEIGDPAMTPLLARRLSTVIAIVIGAIVLAIIFYRGAFRFWKYPLSDLGATVTEHGFSNITSMLFFDPGMFASSLIMFSVGASLAKTAVEHRRIKCGLAVLCAAGFIVIIFPYNINDNIHMSGAAAVFGSFWGTTVLLLLESRKSIGELRFWLLQLLLQMTLLPYAALFAIGLPVKQAFQKPAVLGLMVTLRIVLLLSSRRDAAQPPPRGNAE